MLDDYDAILRLSPAYLGKLKSRLQAMIDLKEHISRTIRHFETYTHAGQTLCTAMVDLAGSFESFQKFKGDVSFRLIHRVLLCFQSTFQEYFEQIDSFVIKPLREFLRKDIEKAESDGSHATHAIDSYLRAADSYAAPRKKGSDQDAYQRLMEAHNEASKKDLLFERSLVHVESKSLIDMSTTVCFPFCSR
jgi:hypothetical protein